MAATNAIIDWEFKAPISIPLVKQLLPENSVTIISGTLKNIGTEMSWGGPDLYDVTEGKKRISGYGGAHNIGASAPFILSLTPVEGKFPLGLRKFEFWGRTEDNMTDHKIADFGLMFVAGEGSPVPEKSYIEFNTNIPVNVRVDGKIYKANINSPVKLEISPGQHSVDLTADGYENRNYSHNWILGESFPAQSFSMKEEEIELPLPTNWNELSATEQQTFLNEVSGMKSGAIEPIDWTDFALLIGPGSLLKLGTGAIKGLFSAIKISIPRLTPLTSKGFINIIKSAPKVIEEIQIKTSSELWDLALKSPETVVAWFKALKPGEYTAFLNTLKNPVVKYATDQKVARLILDDAAKNLPLSSKLIALLPSGKQMILLGAGIAGIASWASVDNLTWVLTGAIRDLIQAGEYEKALESIAGARTTLKGIYDNPVWSLVANVFTGGMAKGVYDGMFTFLDSQEVIALKGQAEGKLGSIAIKTVPAGATIWIDDKQKTYPSNTVYDEQPVGQHKIRLELKGYITETKEIEIKTGEQTEVIHEFTLIDEEMPSTAGRLQWDTKNNTTKASIGASFYVNGRLEKSFASSYVVDLKPGTYELKWTAIGYEDYTDTTGIIAGKLTDLTVNMIPLEEPDDKTPGVTCETLGYLTTQPEDGRNYELITVRGLTCFELKEITAGTLELSSNPEAEIWILGNKFEHNTPTNIPLEQGMYDITLKAQGYVNETIRVYINARQTIVRAVTLQAEEQAVLPRKVWRIDVDSLPSSAKILVNYAFTDKYTPDYILLDPGEYLITLTKSGHKPYHVPLTLEEF